MKLGICFMFIATVYILNVNGAFENFLCQKDPKAPLYFPCTKDCEHNHGAAYGECSGVERGDFNCYCKGRRRDIYNASLLCFRQEDNFRTVCNVDCMCHHGAKGGYCDFEKKACICSGKNSKNVNCPYDNIPNYAKFVYAMVGEEGLGDYGMTYIRPFLKNKQA